MLQAKSFGLELNMFSHKKVISIRRGNPVPSDAKYIKSEQGIVDYEDSGHWAFSDTPIYAWFDVYEVPCNEDGTRELKPTYEVEPNVAPWNRVQ